MHTTSWYKWFCAYFCPMEWWEYALLGSGMMIVAFLVARYYKKQGFFFWRTFIFSLLALAAIAVLLFKDFLF